MQVDVRSLANTLLKISWNKGVEVSNLKLQKLCFLAHGWHFGFFKTPLVRGDFEAWEYGPVQPVLYSQFKRFGRNPINVLATHLNVEIGDLEIAPLVNSPEAIKSIEFTFLRYGHMSAAQLVEITHAPGTPWDQTIRKYSESPSLGMIISNELVDAYFSNLRAKERHH